MNSSIEWLVRYYNIWWFIPLLYLPYLLWFYRKYGNKIASNRSPMQEHPPDGFTLLQMGFLLQEESACYEAQTAYLLQEGYIEPASTEKAYRPYQRTQKGRSTLDAQEKFHLNKLLFPKTVTRSSRDGGKAEYAPQLGSDKTELWQMLSKWAHQERFTKVDIHRVKSTLSLSIFVPLFALTLLLSYFIFVMGLGMDFLDFVISLVVWLGGGFIFSGALFLWLTKRVSSEGIWGVFLWTLWGLLALIPVNYFIARICSSWNNPFVAISLTALEGIFVYAATEPLSDKGLGLQGKLLGYRRYLKQNPQALREPYALLFGISYNKGKR
jgi:hypothetical protein